MDEIDTQDAPFDRVASELDDGLKSCRSLLDDYRAKLGAKPLSDDSNDVEAPDRTSA